MFRQSLVSTSGYPGFRIWCGPAISIRPPLAFVVYVCYDTSHYSPTEKEDLADSLWRECAPPDNSAEVAPMCLNIVLIGHVPCGPCLEESRLSYRNTWRGRDPTDPLPVYRAPNGDPYTGFYIVAGAPEQPEGLALQFFDAYPDAYDGDFPPDPIPLAHKQVLTEAPYIWPTRKRNGPNLWTTHLRALSQTVNVADVWAMRYYDMVKMFMGK